MRCGQLLGSMAAGPQLARISGSGSPAPVLDAVFLETGFQPAAGVGQAQAALLQQLNTAVSWVLGMVVQHAAAGCWASVQHASPCV